MPSHAKYVKKYDGKVPIFSFYEVENYLQEMFNPIVQLKSGGYIVIGITEALVAIDVNSGRATKERSIEETALKTNLEAASEIARQLKLRDLAGLIVIDFIDMEERKNNIAVEKTMRDCISLDRARIQIGRISSFGLLEMEALNCLHTIYLTIPELIISNLFCFFSNKNLMQCRVTTSIFLHQLTFNVLNMSFIDVV